jgi:CRP-like cAMP-binding protein
MRQGEIGSEMFVLVSGKARIERDGKPVAERGPSEMIGEIALVAHVPRVATATVVEPGRAFVIGHADFHSLMDQLPTIRNAVFEALASRLSTLDPDAA